MPVMPTYVASGSFATGTGNITPGLPTGWQAGDLHVMFVENWPGTSGSPEAGPATPAGWTAGSVSTNGGGAGATITRLSVFYRVAVGGDTDPTITDPGDHACAIIHGFRGARQTTSVHQAATSQNATPDTAASFPSVTTTRDDCIIVLGMSTGWDAPSEIYDTDIANGALANLTERSANQTNQGNGGGIFVATGELATAGAVGTTTLTLTGSSSRASVTIAIDASVEQAASGTTSPASVANSPRSSIAARPTVIG